MAKPFSNLMKKISPERRARIKEKVQKTLAATPTDLISTSKRPPLNENKDSNPFNSQ